MTTVSSLAALQDAVREPGSWQPRGQGTGLHRGYIPAAPVRRLRADFLNRVVEYSPQDLTITVGSGLPVAELQRTLAEKGQWVPGAWACLSCRTVGGWLGADARGPLAGVWGSARDHLLRVQWVNGEGKLLEAGARVVKSVAGYDFMKLLVGSLGEFGFVTEVTLKAPPRPAFWTRVRCTVEGESELLALMARARPLQPGAIVLRGPGGHSPATVDVAFAGPEERATALAGDFNRAGHPGEVRAGAEPPVWDLEPAETRIWGGLLPGAAWNLYQGAAWGEAWVMDLLRGHVWAAGGDAPDPGALAALRALAGAGEGHLHVDSFQAPSWGREPEAEVALSRKIKAALDPRERWVAGRLPGRV